MDRESEAEVWRSKSLARDSALVREAYRTANPEKLENGDVELLLRKYAGQERLLLRRVQYRYSLDLIKSVLWKREPPADNWTMVKVALRADGNLRWGRPPPPRGDGSVGDLDARQCAVNELAPGVGGREGVFAVFVSDEAAHEAENSLLFASDDALLARRWVLALRETTLFFARLSRERVAQREEAALADVAFRESERTANLEAERRHKMEQEEELATRRVAALSELHAESESRQDALPQLHAELEAALDDALRHASAAASFERRSKLKSAHGEYRCAVGAFIVAKEAISSMASLHRPEPVVLDLIDAGSEQCKTAARACHSRAEGDDETIWAGGGNNNDDDDDEDSLGDYSASSDPPIVDGPRLIPAQVEKVVLDADDV